MSLSFWNEGILETDPIQDVLQSILKPKNEDQGEVLVLDLKFSPLRGYLPGKRNLVSEGPDQDLRDRHRGC